jgi:hypothetical protein
VATSITLAPGEAVTISAAAAVPVPPPLPVRKLGWWHSDQDLDIFSIEAGLGRQFDGGRTFDAYDRWPGKLSAQDLALAAAGRGRCSSLKLDMYDKIMAQLAPAVAVSVSPIKQWTLAQLALPGVAYLSIDHEADAKSAQAHAAGQKETFPTVYRAWVDFMRVQSDFDPKRHIPLVIDTNYLFGSRIGAIWPGAQYSPYIGVDVYGTDDPAADLAAAVAFATAQKVRMVWPEWGYTEQPAGALSKADLLREYAVYAKSVPFIDWICWWSGTPDFRYDTTPYAATSYRQTGLLLA